MQRIESAPGEIQEHNGQRFVITDPNDMVPGRRRFSGRADRPESPTMAAGDQGVSHQIRHKSRKMLLIFTGILMILIASIMIPLKHRGLYLQPANRSDTIVVADFTNSTDVPELGSGPGPFYLEDRTNVPLLDAMRSALKLPPSLHTLPWDRVSDILKRLNRRPDEPLTPELAREVCLRANGGAVLARSVALNGNRYRVEMRATDCHTGETLAFADGETDNEMDVPKVVREVTSQLLVNLGTAKQ